MIEFRPRFARFATNVLTRYPSLSGVFRKPLAYAFDGIAKDWEGSRVTPVHMAALEAALDRVAATPTRILDLGTGTGAAARVLAARWPDAEVMGVDLSHEMIREAKARGTRERFEVGDASALMFADGAFDLVNLLNMIPFFDELARVTAAGGTVIIAFSRGAATPIWVPLDRVRRELEQRGFAHVADVDGGAGKALLAVKNAVS